RVEGRASHGVDTLLCMRLRYLRPYLVVVPWIRDVRNRFTLVGPIALAVLYTAIAKLGLSLDAVSGFATVVWPPTGLALAMLVLFGLRMWPGVCLGALAVNLWMGAPVAVALGIAVGNTLEAVVGAAILRRGARSAAGFDGLRYVVTLIVGAAVL